MSVAENTQVLQLDRLNKNIVTMNANLLLLLAEQQRATALLEIVAAPWQPVMNRS